MSDLAAHYTIKSKIRETVHADLFRGHRNADLSPVVLKVPRGDYPSAIQLAKLKHEYGLLRSLQVPGVVRTFGLEKFGNNVALVLEDVGDRSLDKVVGPGPRRFDARTFLRLAISITRVVESIHRNQVIHKDIKPHHFFENERGEIKLVDFGLATRLSQEAQRATSVALLEGTLAYMSPEQTGRMNRALDRRTDLYSLGVTLYELCTGALPFQSTDPLELVHSHLALRPAAPHEVTPEIPRVISDLVMKLLSKVAEDRYQDAAGLKADLERCLELYDSTGEVASFPLGLGDFSDELRIPQKLYGRTAESATLLATFERARRGASELLLISGYSGIGKSALVNEIHRQLVRRGHFVAGKFDQLGRSVPYAPVAAACRDLIRLILTESTQALDDWRRKIADAVGPNGQVLVDLVPELELVIGKQPKLQELGPSEQQHRFELVFQNFLRVFTSAEHPLALFLDDLQWADPASLRLIHLILTNPQSSHLLVIGAYRDNEVDPLHPLTVTLADLRKSGAVVGELKLRPLAIDDICQLLSDTLGLERRRVEPLAELSLRKTHGNPFFLGQFLTALHTDKLLTFDADERAWTWDLERIEKTMVTDNVVDFMVAKLKRLSPATQHLLRLGACLGYQFDRLGLSVIAEQSLSDVTAHLWEALREGLLLPLDAGEGYLHDRHDDGTGGATGNSDALNASCRFLHDRVQQAAYELVDEAERQRVHLRIGRLMLSKADGQAVASRGELFEVVNHMNLGAALIADPEERRQLAALNLAAGRRARDAAAYGTAAKLLGSCLGLLGSGAWETDYDVVFPAHLTKAECELVSTRVEEALRLLDVADQHARTPLDRAAARELRTVVLTNANRVKDAAACGVEAARLLGVDIPSDPAAIGPAIGAEFGAVQAALAGRTIESLVDLPAMTDPASLAVLEIIYKTCPSINQTNPGLMGLVVCKAVNLSLRHGNSPVSSYFYDCYGMVLAIMGNFEMAYRFGQLALQLNEKMQNRAVDGANHFVFAAFISHWRQHSNESLEHLRRALKVSLDGGDYIHAGYAVSHYVAYRFCKGDNLDEIKSELPGFFELLDRTGDVINSRELVLLQQLIANLQGRTAAQGTLAGEGFDENEFQRTWLSSGNIFLISSFHLFRGIVRFLAGEVAGAADDLGKSAAALIPCNALTNEHRYYQALVTAAQLRAAGPDDAGVPGLIEALREHEEVLRKWSESAPANFGHRHALVAAERAALAGDGAAALDSYDRAIGQARDNGFLFHEALANELAAKFLVWRGRKKIARAYFADAQAAYQRCGATAKAHELGADAHVGHSSVSQEVGAGQLDALTIIKASQAISTEIVLPRLVESLMRIVIQQAGAQRGYLMLMRDRELCVEAAAGDGAGKTERTPAARCFLPHSILGYVQRTKEKVLLADADRDNMFSGDPYLVERRPRSLLCLPMTRQGQLVGMLYLENSLAGDTFSPDRVAILEVLSGQAAISLENAALYDEMEKRVEDRTHELEASLRLIKENQAQLIAAERKAAVAHYEREIAIAQQIQTSILPKELRVAGLELAARMVTASEVGGDYYDLQRTRDGGCWLGIGDVSGHGLDAGLIMLMIQSGLASLMRSDQFTDPATLLCLVNRMLHENVRVRLGRDEFATLSLFRVYPDGRFVVAGAHEDILIWRSDSEQCQQIPTVGTWLGVTERAEMHMKNVEHLLRPGDVMMLYTDGITEARSTTGEQFGIRRLASALDRLHLEPADTICEQVLSEVKHWSQAFEDDQTIVIVRYQGSTSGFTG
jgi:predicted ATPase/serine phosphatase RsbU (regulator of sigma subunit)/tRNA A-37 threonylcarbamoyl transferase component Bud32